MLRIRPTIDRIINAGMDANTPLIIKDAMEPKGMLKSVILTDWVLWGMLLLLSVTSMVWFFYLLLSLFYKMNDNIMPKLKVKNSKKVGAKIYFIE